MEMEERLRLVEQELPRLGDAIAFAKGKAIGLEAAVITMAREWGNSPQALIEALHDIMEKLDDPKASPGFAGPQKQVAMEIIEMVSSCLHSRNR
ncbi:hypothetical protein [Xanthomonas campestris]|jgi:hypothetical protein|uniref:hypothetical protein n=1 Tax=Xanthomonas campestris TaxID=339 RepID=UPI000E32424D|nr:hypothetical protein [Xanthomonas campestris]MCF8799224.1 hypothetical protein [Xanthomonas campestris pv. campestris]MCF8812166.1 hypothetical protein [Xanthomonas campestris pv. campestris]MEA9569614.1 hypothetical protein [Xanthomonas campestris]MEA9627439.1 hypothetical protein [Xanthomonas campestris]MEA9630876.1 hypothetical protein [Xanthomonas campestris]